MITKQDWIRFFPLSEPRSEQITAIDFILNEFQNGKKFVIAELGTGTGKSAIAVTVSRYIQTVKNGDGSWFLTTQKVLQQQYMNDFGNHKLVQLKTIKSANNYRCQIFDHSDVSMTCAEIHRLMNAHKFFQTVYKTCTCKCRYRDEKNTFLNAIDSLTNYSYFFAESTYAGGIVPRDLLICDEAHTIEESLSKFVEISISERFARSLNVKTFPDNVSDMLMIVNWIKTKYVKSVQNRIKRLKQMLDDEERIANQQKGEQISLAAHIKESELLDKHICKINRFLDNFNEQNWCVNLEQGKTKATRKIVFKPIDVSVYSHEKLFNFGGNVLLLSATIVDKDTYCRTLGIDPQDVGYVRLPSPFPIKNRPIVVLPVGSMSKERIDSTLPLMVDVIKELLKEHASQKGIIHTVNFKIANFIYENVKSSRLLIHDSTTRDGIIEHHVMSDEPTILLSPSMLEGVNLDGEKSRFQIFCKVPFPYLGDEVIRKRMALHKGWYELQTIRSLIQGWGRSIRSMDDHAVTYVLDSDWDRFLSRNKKMVPDDIVRSIVLQ